MHEILNISGQKAINEITSAIPFSQSFATCELAFSYVLRSMGSISQIFCMKGFSQRCYVLSHHLASSHTTLKMQQVFHQRFLNPSINSLRKEDALLAYFHPQGLCKGMGFWFHHLYFTTREKFDCPEKQMKAIAQQFKRGAPKEAAILHFVPAHEISKYLPLKTKEVVKTSAEDILNQLEQLPLGNYSIYTSSHVIDLIKATPSKHFIFDPDQGTFSAPDAHWMKKAITHTIKNHDSRKDIIIDQITASD